MAGKKSIEFYKKVTGGPPGNFETLNRHESVVRDGRLVYRREVKRRRKEVQEPGSAALDHQGKIKKLFTRQQKFEQRLKALETNYERMHRKIEDMVNTPSPQALFQAFQQPPYNYQSAFSGYQEQLQSVDPAGPNSPAADWRPPDSGYPQMALGYEQQTTGYEQYYQYQQYPQGYQQGDAACQEGQGAKPQHGDNPDSPGTNDSQNPPQCLDPIQQLPKQFQYFPPGTQADPFQNFAPRAIMAVYQINTPQGPNPTIVTPENDDIAGGFDDAEIVIENNIRIREVPAEEQDKFGDDLQEKDNGYGPDRYKYAAGEKPGDTESSRRDSNPIPVVTRVRDKSPRKRDTGSSPELGTFVRQLGNLYEKVAMLEVDNSRLQDEQITLKQANAKMKTAVKALRLEQSRVRQPTSEPFQVLANVQPAQQDTKIQCGGGGATTTGVEICVEAVADKNSATTTSTDRSTDQTGQESEKQKETQAEVKSDINIFIQSEPHGPVSVNQEHQPAPTMAYVQAPVRPQNRDGAVDHQRRTSSLPNNLYDSKSSESEIESYKKKMDDLMDWYHTCKRKDTFLEQTTMSYLKQQLGGGCHFLDDVSVFYWEVDKCSNLHLGKTNFRDFRIFSGPIIDLSCRGLIRFVIDPSLNFINLYVEILITARPKYQQKYNLKVRDAFSRKAFHDEEYNAEDMFGFKGVFSYPGTPCLGFFSVVVKVDCHELDKNSARNDRLIIELSKV